MIIRSVLRVKKHPHFLRFHDSTIFKILTTSKPLARGKVFKFTTHIEFFPVSPMSHIFLPLWDDLTWVVQIPERLTMRYKSTANALPIIDPVKRLFKVHQDTVQEVLTLETILIYQFCSPFNLCYLPRSIAAESDTLYPFHTSQKPSDIIGN